MQSTADSSRADRPAAETTAELLRRGELDAAIAGLATTTDSIDGAERLAYLRSQRGDYAGAIAALSDPRWASELRASSLRARGNAEWRSGDLASALTDLRRASALADEPARSAIDRDLGVLQAEVRLERKLSTRLDAVSGAFWAVVLVACAGWAVANLQRTRTVARSGATSRDSK